MSDDRGPAGRAWDKYREYHPAMKSTDIEIVLDAFFEGYRAGMEDALTASKELAKKIFGEARS